MATSSANEMEVLVNCQICFCEYDSEMRQPKSLPCLHTFCLVCVQATRQQDTITCPFCRRCTSIDNNSGEWVLPTNHYVLQLLRLSRTESSPRLSNIVPAEPEVEEDDEQLRIALAMSNREMEEEEALNEAIHQSLLPQQHEQQIRVSELTYNATRQHANTPSVSRANRQTAVRNSTSDDMSNEEDFYSLLFLSALFYYAFLLFCQLFVFFWHRPEFLSGVFLFVFCYVPYRCQPNSNSANPSNEEIFFIILFSSVLSYNVFLLVWELFMFFLYHLELLLVIVFQLCLGFVNFDFSSNPLVPLSNTF